MVTASLPRGEEGCFFNAKTQSHKEGAAAHTEARKGMTDVMRYAVRCVATYVQVLSHAVGHAFACFRMRVCALFVALRLCVEICGWLCWHGGGLDGSDPTCGCVHIRPLPLGGLGETKIFYTSERVLQKLFVILHLLVDSLL